MRRDATEFARGAGYNGRRRVIVLDGRVVSHGGADWFEWIQRQISKPGRRNGLLS